MSKKNKLTIMENFYQGVYSDECYTTTCESEKLVDFIIKNNLIGKDKIIWLPFDNEYSNIYRALKKNGFKTTLSNLELGLDFYLYEPEHWDIIVTNPPFKGRTKLFDRLYSFGKPFIILQATQMFNNQFSVNYLCEMSDDTKLLLPRSRMNFLTLNNWHDTNDKKYIQTSKGGASFYSFWLCYKVDLPKTFNELPDNGREKELERYDVDGNPVIDNHRNLFNI